MAGRVKNVLITGASRGIGLAIAEKLRTAGYNLFLPPRQDLDLLSNESIKTFITKNQDVRIEAIVNNAGINYVAPIEEITDQQIQEIFQVNLIAPLKLIRGFVGQMKKNGGGRIVNISSIWGVVSKPHRTAYSISKFGLHGLTRTLAAELGKNNILVNSLCPGYINTDMTKKNVTPEERSDIEAKIPLGRFADPAEIAELVEFLISDRNTYLTGQILVIDGGYTAL